MRPLKGSLCHAFFYARAKAKARISLNVLHLSLLEEKRGTTILHRPLRKGGVPRSSYLVSL
jgi:hypothetical protein